MNSSATYGVSARMEARVSGKSVTYLSQSVAYHWSATENSSTNAKNKNLSNGNTNNNVKSTTYGVRCVR